MVGRFGTGFGLGFRCGNCFGAGFEGIAFLVGLGRFGAGFGAGFGGFGL